MIVDSIDDVPTILTEDVTVQLGGREYTEDIEIGGINPSGYQLTVKGGHFINCGLRGMEYPYRADK